MNERMQELAVEASKHVTATVPFNDPSYAELIKLFASQDNTVLNAFKEKFAELIVQECMTIAKNWEDQLENAKSLSESNAVGIVTYRISRQFGVKE